jgi:hypothetical protein
MLGLLVLYPSWVHDIAERSARNVHNWSTRCWLLQSSEVHEVIQAKKTGQAPRVTSTTIEVGGGPTTVVEMELETCQLMECTLGDTSVEHPQYYLQKVLTWPSSSSSLLRLIRLSRYPLGQSHHSQGRWMTRHRTKLSNPEAGVLVLFWTALSSSHQYPQDEYHTVPPGPACQLAQLPSTMVVAH